MRNLSDLETAALERIAAIYPDLEPDIGRSFRSCLAMTRQNTGGGFFTDLTSASCILLQNRVRSPLGDAWIAIKGMRFGICCLVFLTEGYPALLEGYSVGGEDTSNIDFGSCEFAVREGPPTDQDKKGFDMTDPPDRQPE